VVVFDDDPTGSQTLHGCPLLLRWDGDTLAAALRHPSPFLFLLANSRALAPAAARERLLAIVAALGPALEAARAAGVIDRWLLVSRGDSTLRGHFPLEVEAIAEALGPFDATLLVPAFLEGGRTTVAGVHRLQGTPVHQTPFGRDRLFGYSTSYLPDWVAEKSGGRLPAAGVGLLSLDDLERGGEHLRRRLVALALPRSDMAVPAWAAGRVVAVDACSHHQLAHLGEAMRALAAASDPVAAAVAPPGTAGPDAGDGGAADKHGPAPLGLSGDASRSGGPGLALGPGPRLLVHCAASLLNALAPLPPQPRGAAELAALRRRGGGGGPLPGLLLVGSHVPLADRQLARLLAEPECAAVEVPVETVQRVLEGPLPDRLLASLEAAWLERLEGLLAAGRTPVLHTSRGEVPCRHDRERRHLGLSLAGAMARLVGRLAPRLGYVISKGGTTSQTLLADGLGLAAVELQGQLLPGVSLVLAPAGGAMAAGGVAGALDLPVVTVPGNLGGEATLAELLGLFEGPGGRGADL
jgi:uncharacterized protein YgbK (DUF1537 family)